jgi:hypothetical protein
MRKTIKTALLASALLAGGTYAASAQTVYRQQPLPGETGTPADIVTVPLGIAGAVVAAPFEGRSAYEGGPMYIQGDYQHRNEPGAAPGGVSETGRKSGVAENPQDIGG